MMMILVMDASSNDVLSVRFSRVTRMVLKKMMMLIMEMTMMMRQITMLMMKQLQMMKVTRAGR